MALLGRVLTLPSRRCRVVFGARDRVPVPAGCARSGVKGAHRAGRCHHARVVANRGPDHHRVAHGDRRRGDLELAGPQQRHAGIDADLALVAEPGATLRGGRIDCNQPRIVGAGKDAVGAGPVSIGVLPVRNAAAGELVGGFLAQVDLRVEAPAFLAGARIEGNDFVERRAEDQRIADEDRGALRGGAFHVRRAGGHVAGAVLPRQRQAMDVVRGDLLRLAVAVPAGVAAVGGPAGSDIDRAGRAGRLGGRAVDVEAVRTAEQPNHRTAEYQHGTEYGDQRGTQEQGLGELGHASLLGWGGWVNPARPYRVIHTKRGQSMMPEPMSNPLLALARREAPFPSLRGGFVKGCRTPPLRRP